ncbi:hypothetical protein [Kitasatospora sp. NPDC006786]|uniref:hypothetical protein n=1 Tax=unclassified Kitasatospora TaxID=2633591 RepID=UPI0033FC435E
MAFPHTPLDVHVELRLDGVWTDITADVRLDDRIHIERGRHDEASRVDPAKCSMTLSNPNGKYSPRNAASPLYGRIGRNTPLRVRVPGPTTYLDITGALGGRASTPDTAALHVTDLDVRVDLDQLWHIPTDNTFYEIAGRYEGGATGRSWRLHSGNGYLFLDWSEDGTNSKIRALSSDWPIESTPTGRLAVRAVLDVDNGAGGCTARFYTAATMAGPWVQLGGPVTAAGTTTIYPGTAPLVLGDNPAVASVFALPAHVLRAEVRNGIDGTVVAAPDFTAQTPGTTVFADGVGRTWSVVAPAALSNLVTRFTGEVASWLPRRDVSGHDTYIPIQAAGIMRRLGQGAAPLQSTLRRYIPTGRPLAYWPMEDERGASQAYSPVYGVGPLETSAVDFGADSDLTGSSPLPTLRTGAQLRGAVPAPAVAPTMWQINFVYRCTAAPSATSRLLTWTSTGTVRTWVLDAGALDGTAVHIYGLDANGVTVMDYLAGNHLFAGPEWRQMIIRATQNGGQVDWSITWYAVSSDENGSGAGSYAGSVGVPTEIDTLLGEGLNGMGMGHLAVFDHVADVYNRADNGWLGNRPSERIGRLCSEEGVPVVIQGDVDSEVPLGSQRPGALLALLQEAADSDHGILAERIDDLALWYRAGHLAFNQSARLVLDYAGGDVAPPLEPADDDQGVRNDITITRAGGSSARAVDTTSSMSTQPPPVGVGRYDEGVTLSLWRDEQLVDLAGWRLHLGTWDGPRYPSVRVDLAAAPHLIPTVLGLDLRDRIDIIGMPPEDGPTAVALLAEGYAESIGQFDWDMVFSCQPAGPWSVAVLEDPVLGRADTAGSQLAAPADATATVLSLTTTSGPTWTTDPADLPFDVGIAGEQVRFLDVVGARGDHFGRTAAGGWGTATSGQAWTTSGGSAADYSVQSGRGLVAMPSVNVSRYTLLPAPSADVDLRATVATDKLAVGGGQFVALVARYQDGSNSYLARLELGTAQEVILTIRKRVAGAETLLQQYTTGLTHAAGRRFALRFQTAGSTLRARAWLDGAPEPSVWQAETTDTALTAAGQIGTRSILSSTSTTPLPVTASWDDFTTLGPDQSAVVTRSVNGVVKTLPAAAPVRLWQPAIISL